MERGGHALVLDTDISQHAERRASFNRLAERTFGLSFEAWYQRGGWTDRYRPYALLCQGQVVASVSVSRIDTAIDGRPKRFLQLGTVMTDEAFRGLGLSRWLMERVLMEWRGRCDGIYLYANDGVRDFYPRFGFAQAQEYQAAVDVTPGGGAVRRLDMESAGDTALLHEAYRRNNPFSRMPMLDGWGLVLFHCMGPLRDGVYRVEAADAIVILGEEAGAPLCYDILGGEASSVAQILAPFIRAGGERMRLGFAPKDIPEEAMTPLIEEDTTLFVLDGMENPFALRRTMLPLLSRA